MNSPRLRSQAGFVLAIMIVIAGCTNETAPADDSCDYKEGVVCTYLGTGEHGFNLDGLPLQESMLYWPIDLTFDPDGRSYVVDFNNHRIREITEDGTLETVIGTDFVGDGPEDLSDLTPKGAEGTEVLLNHPTQLLAMPDGRPLLVSWHNHKLRRYDPETGRVTVECGRGAGFAGDGGDAAMALLNQPVQAAVTEDGVLFVLDQRNQIVRRIDEDGVITTVAGTPKIAGFAGDGGPPLRAQLNLPAGPNPLPGGGLAIDEDGVLYVSDTLNHRIRKIDLEADEITTIAGTGKPGFSGDDGPAEEAEIDYPRKLTFGPDGRLYVGDQGNNRIRAIDLRKSTITTVVGGGDAELDGDGHAPEDTALDRPSGVSFDDEGVMYVLDTYHSRVRRVLLEGTP